jgi:hypothetical protein
MNDALFVSGLMVFPPGLRFDSGQNHLNPVKIYPGFYGGDTFFRARLPGREFRGRR